MLRQINSCGGRYEKIVMLTQQIATLLQYNNLEHLNHNILFILTDYEMRDKRVSEGTKMSSRSFPG